MRAHFAAAATAVLAALSTTTAVAETMTVVKVGEDTGFVFDHSIPQEVIERFVAEAEEAQKLDVDISRWFERAGREIVEWEPVDRLEWCMEMYPDDQSGFLECLGIHVIIEGQEPIMIDPPFPPLGSLEGGFSGRVLVDVPDINEALEAVTETGFSPLQEEVVAAFLSRSIGVASTRSDVRSKDAISSLQSRLVSFIPQEHTPVPDDFVPQIVPNICWVILCAQMEGCPCTNYIWPMLPKLGIDIDQILAAEEAGVLAMDTVMYGDLMSVR